LFKIQPLLKDFRLLYPSYVDVLVQIDPDIKQIILDQGADVSPGEEISYTFGNGSFLYKLKADVGKFDTLYLTNALTDLIMER
jgi:hypothetical protein